MYPVPLIAASLVAAALFALPSAAPEPPDRFALRMERGGLEGSEEFRLERSPAGYRLTSRTSVLQAGRSIVLDQEQSLDPDWGLVRYRLEANVGGQTQTIEAWRNAGQVEMRVQAGAQSPSATFAFSPSTTVLDNLIVSHYQVLLRRLAAEPAVTERTVLVPQRLAALTCRTTRSETAAGRLNGEAVTVRRYTLEVANVLIECCGEEPTGRLMLVTVPVQGLAMTREGFELVPAAAPAATPADAEERPIAFQSGGLNLPGTLCLPKVRTGRVPVVVFVHGSGPNDRDETVGPNRPFRDLAHGLAAGGIASLRYDKRTHAFRGQIDARAITVDQEVIDDAVAALEHAAALPETDPSRVFLLGHSMGGMLAPFIAARARVPLRGVLLMAATVRPLDEIMIEQISFQMRSAGAPDADVAAKTDALRTAFARVRSGQAPDGEMVMFAPARYWRELFRLDVAGALGRLPAPVLVLQGGRDVQVGRRDYERLREALAAVPEGRKEFRWFERLNHLFMEVEGTATGAEYGRAGKVDPGVTAAIVEWIRKQGQ